MVSLYPMRVRGIDQDMQPELTRRRREYIMIAFVAALIVAVALFEIYLSRFTEELQVSNSLLFFTLFNINVLLAILFIFLVVRNLVKLFFERRTGVLGANLRLRLVAGFVGLSLIPTAALFVLAMVFVNYSLEGWFDPTITNVFETGRSIVQTRYDEGGSEAVHFARNMADHVADRNLLPERGRNDAALTAYLDSKREEYGLAEVQVYRVRPSGRGGVLIARVSEDGAALGNENDEAGLDDEFLDAGLGGEEGYRVDPAGQSDMLRGMAPIVGGDGTVRGLVVAGAGIDTSLFGQLHTNEASYNDYLSLKRAKIPLKTTMITVLIAVTIIVVFSAVWFGIYLARGITVPIERLAEGTRRVAEGDLDHRIDIETRDELGSLVTAFNQMVEDLAVSKEELESRRTYMEAVLANIDAGVISVDGEGRITTMNKAAENILEFDGAKVLGQPFTDVLQPEQLDIITTVVREFSQASGSTIKRQVSLVVGDRRSVNLLTRVTRLTDDDGATMGMVVVFDDMTHLLRAQRAEAWRDVARRVAHEIKNPLTPIKLSAQRLRKRYSDLVPADDPVFDECTRTIMRQADDLKMLVNEFSHFARLPEADPRPNDMNGLIREVLVMYRESHKDTEFRFEEERRLPVFDFDAEQMKRALINLLDNALYAMKGEGEVTVRTLYNEQLEVARLEVSDTGPGIEPGLRERLFEPYFSTKEDGSGLGLAIVNRIISDHYGYIRVRENIRADRGAMERDDNRGPGATFIIEIPIIQPATAPRAPDTADEPPPIRAVQG